MSHLWHKGKTKTCLKSCVSVWGNDRSRHWLFRPYMLREGRLGKNHILETFQSNAVDDKVWLQLIRVSHWWLWHLSIRIISWKTDFFMIVTNNNKIAFDININVTSGILVFLFLAKSLGVYQYTTPSKGTGTCSRKKQNNKRQGNRMWAWIWSLHSPDSCFFMRYLGATLDCPVLFLFPRPEEREKGSDVSSDLAPKLNAMSPSLPKSRRTFLGRWRDDLIWSGFALTWMQNVRCDLDVTTFQSCSKQ